jgi:type II restriction enzyme
MSQQSIDARLQRILILLPNLSKSQIGWIDSVATAFTLPKLFTRYDQSDLVSLEVLESFGDALRIHHCFSAEPFSKDKFEYTLERVLLADGRVTVLAPRGNPGRDITIGDDGFSLKTEAAAAINASKIHISKFHELGKGQWDHSVEDLYGLRDQFISHLTHYDRVLVLRKLKKDILEYHYEMVEIPMPLLMRAEFAASEQFEMKFDSRQTPKPGYCYIPNKNRPDFMLYFDGGTERKLQIKGLLKSLCIVHATWQFDVTTGMAP